MPSLNKALIIGHLGRDPETRYLPDGKAVCTFSVATSESWKSKDGEKKESTEWHRITIFGKLAEIAAEYLKKGSSVYVEGKIQTRKWKDKEGQERYTTEIVADAMQMLGGRSQEPVSRSERKETAPASGAMRDVDSDIPFAPA